MKTTLLTSFILSSALFAGCATAASPIVLGSVGPETQRVDQASKRGGLIVFSGVEVHQGGNDPSNTYTHHSDYEIWTADGSKRLQRVRNAPAPFVADAEPVRTELAPGQYLVKAMANAYNSVSVPVTIAANRITAVHLDGSLGTDKAMTSADKIYLPNGEIVGTRAAGQTIADTGK